MTENNVDERSAFRDRRRSRYIVVFAIDFLLNLFENSIALYYFHFLCTTRFMQESFSRKEFRF